jgi:methionyl-tRNA formyltransferase
MKAHLIFMGHFVIALEEICKREKPDLVIVEDKPCSSEVVKFCDSHGVVYKKVRSFLDILCITSIYENIDLTVVSSFGLILRKAYIQKNKYIVNFHPGDIPNCRGRHPLPAAIKNKHEFMGITAHLITDEQIDYGRICRKILIPIDYTRNYEYNADRLVKLLPMMVSSIMEEFVSSGGIVGVCVKSIGNYYPPLSKEELDKIFGVECLSEL